MRLFLRATAAFIAVALTPAMNAAEFVTHDEHDAGNEYDRNRVNISEPVCRNNLRDQLLAQQVAFSNSNSSAEQRRLAEESIDIARKAFEKSQSYCEATFALTDFLEQDLLERSTAPKLGQIQSFK